MGMLERETELYQLKEEVVQASINVYMAFDGDEYDKANEMWDAATKKLIGAMKGKE